MKNFNDLINAIKNEFIVYNGRLGRISESYWSTVSDNFCVRCVSITAPHNYWEIQFSGHYIGQMKTPKGFYDMLFRQTPPNIMDNKLFKLVFL